MKAAYINIESDLIEIKCYSELNYPYGENHVLKVPTTVQIYELIIQIEKLF